MNTRHYPVIELAGLAPPSRPISFVCVRFSGEYEHNILKSECVHDPLNQFIEVDNRLNLFFPSLGAALCHGIDQARHDLIAMVHEDVVLPRGWQARFEASLNELEAVHRDWGLIGAVGWAGTAPSTPLGHWSDPHRAEPVNSFGTTNFIELDRLDEQLLILRRAAALRPDPDLPSIHEIGRDLALSLARVARRTFAINAPTIHKYADAEGNLIQTSTKITSRKSLSFQVGHALSKAYLDHKHGLDRGYIPQDPHPALSAAQRNCLDAPVILLGRGGGGTRLASTLAGDCGLFIGNTINASGDSMEMVPAIYRTVLRRLQCRDAWSQAMGPTELRAAAASMLEQAGWPETWGFKLPEAALILPDIRAAFPRARYVHFHRTPEDTVFRRSHMTARLDNEIGRASLVAAYDHIGRDRHRILQDSELLRMAVTTRHQTDLIEAHLAGCPARDLLRLSFEDTIGDPLGALSAMSNFLGLPEQGRTIAETVNVARSQSDTSKFPPDEVTEALRLLRPPRRAFRLWNSLKSMLRLS